MLGRGASGVREGLELGRGAPGVREGLALGGGRLTCVRGWSWVANPSSAVGKTVALICNALCKKSAVFLHYILYRFGPTRQTKS